ncbi:MAG: hypothetical protein MI863_10285 [Desulfobacterales bacterium]|nr:hypothetical protein [Desulfobacterales bacterium]
MDEKQKTVPAFPNRRAVLLAIKDAGYQISRAKFYRDCGKPGKENGQIRVNEDGSVNESEVREYCKTLKRIGGDIEDLNDIQARKTAKEVESLELKVKKQEFELDREKGKYLPRRDFEAELAARAVVLETGLKHHFNTRVGEWIALVCGKPEKAPDLLQELNTALESELGSYATTRSFQVIFEK